MGYGKMANRYQSSKDLVDRLDGTICRYEDVPVYVRVTGNPTARLTLFLLGELGSMSTPYREISHNDPKFDISSPELGYVNFEATASQYNPGGMAKGETRAFYAVRHPVRRYKQGLNEMSTYFSTVDGRNEDQQNAILFSSSMSDSLTGVFPSYQTALDRLEDGTKSIAISQSIALERLPSGLTLVYFRCRNVGWINPSGGKIIMKRSKDAWAYERLIGGERIIHA